MNKFDLTVLIPGIRPHNWQKLYDSIGESTTKSFEAIFIGPFKSLEDAGVPKLELHHVTFLEDWGTPIKCQQRALTHSQGEWITWAADDGIFLPGALDIGFNILDEYEGSTHKTIILGKYYEGNNPTAYDDIRNMSVDGYYVLNHHHFHVPGLPTDPNEFPWLPKPSFLLNVGLVTRQVLEEVGGWDAEKFEVCPLAYNDCSVRLLKHGCSFIMQQELMYQCSHLPNDQGDHGPVHFAQIEHDEEAFINLYTHPDHEHRLVIDIDNWKSVADKWDRRFA